MTVYRLLPDEWCALKHRFRHLARSRTTPLLCGPTLLRGDRYADSRLLIHSPCQNLQN